MIILNCDLWHNRLIDDCCWKKCGRINFQLFITLLKWYSETNGWPSSFPYEFLYSTLALFASSLPSLEASTARFLDSLKFGILNCCCVSSSYRDTKCSINRKKDNSKITTHSFLLTSSAAIPAVISRIRRSISDRRSFSKARASEYWKNWKIVVIANWSYFPSGKPLDASCFWIFSVPKLKIAMPRKLQIRNQKIGKTHHFNGLLIHHLQTDSHAHSLFVIIAPNRIALNVTSDRQVGEFLKLIQFNYYCFFSYSFFMRI